MKLTVPILIFCLVIVCMVPENDAGWFRRTVRRIGRGIRRVGRVIKKVACNGYCPRICNNGICRLACAAGCKGRKKRDLTQNMVGHLTPMPNSFDAYDLNDNSVIERKELALAIGEVESHPDFIKAYSLADVNGDMVLTAKEFYNGPFVFEMDLDDDDLSYCRYRLDLDDDLVDIMEGTHFEEAPNFIDGEEVKDTGLAHKFSDKLIKTPATDKLKGL